MISCNINVKSIDKAALFVGEKGTYLNITLIENRGGRDQYGNDGFIAQDIGKERRLAGEKGPIIGNFKTIGQPAAKPAPRAAAPADDDTPF